MSNLSLLHVDFFYKHLSPHTDVVSCFVNNTRLPYRDAVRDAVTNAATQDGWWLSLYHAIQSTCPLPKVSTLVPMLENMLVGVLSVTVTPTDSNRPSIFEMYNELMSKHMQEGRIAIKEKIAKSRLTSLTPVEVQLIADLIKVYGTGQPSSSGDAKVDIPESLYTVHADGDTGRVTMHNIKNLERLLIHLLNSVTGRAIRFYVGNKDGAYEPVE